ncbi:MAG: N-acetylneuraminate synthase family protein, partial [Microbacterium gubbeenense]
MSVTIGSSRIGGGAPAFVIAEIGLNHNGSVEIAKQLIDV